MREAAVLNEGGCVGVVAAIPGRIVADRIDDGFAPDAIAAGDLRGKARERHQRIHEFRMALAPYPGVHAAHRRAHHQPQVIDAQAFREQPVLRLDHVAVAVLRKFRAQAVTGLGGLAVSDAVGQHDEVASRVEGLARAKQLARELRPHELRATAAGAVTDDHRIAHDSLGVLLRECPGCDSESAAREALRHSRTGNRARRSRLQPASGIPRPAQSARSAGQRRSA